MRLLRRTASAMTKGKMDTLTIRRPRSPRRSAWGNVIRLFGTDPALSFGLVVIQALFLLALYAPVLAPHDPWYMRTRSEEFLPPPFAPSAEFPLGSDSLGQDLLTWVLYGARHTLPLAIGIGLIRVLLGLVLGAISGLAVGSRVDTVLQRINEVFLSAPPLVAALLVILALDIRNGLVPFIVALTLFGWSETYQLTRQQVMTLNNQLFVTSARAAGASTWRVFATHLAPNLAPTLLTLTALQISQSLLLIAELGVLRIFVGGGRSFEFDETRSLTVADMPDWGALIAAGSSNATAIMVTPWVLWVPGIAFASAILGFNLLAEGLSRLALKINVLQAAKSPKTLGILAVLVIVSIPAMLLPDPAADHIAIARQFSERNVANMVEEMQTLDQPSDRSDDMPRLTEYLVQAFAAAGLEPAADQASYVQAILPRPTVLAGDPILEFAAPSEAQSPLFTHPPLDVEPLLYSPAGGGTVEGPVVFAGFGNAGQVSYGYPIDLGAIDVRGKVVFMLMEDYPGLRPRDQVMAARDRGALGAVLIGNPTTLIQYANESYPSTEVEGFPAVRVTPEEASHLLAPLGHDYQGLVDKCRDQSFVSEMPVTARLTVPLEPAKPAGYNVIGMVRGTDASLASQAVLVTAPYPDVVASTSAQVPSAEALVDVAALLHVAQLLHAAEYRPATNIIFAVLSSDGDRHTGAEYYKDWGPISLNDTLAHINLQSLTSLPPVRAACSTPGYVRVGGGVQTADFVPPLFLVVEKYASKLGMDVGDPLPIKGSQYESTVFYSQNRSTVTLTSSQVSLSPSQSRAEQAMGDREAAVRDAGQLASLLIMRIGQLHDNPSL